jgi:undecaprenyl-diphosphatase
VAERRCGRTSQDLPPDARKRPSRTGKDSLTVPVAVQDLYHQSKEAHNLGRTTGLTRPSADGTLDRRDDRTHAPKSTQLRASRLAPIAAAIRARIPLLRQSLSRARREAALLASIVLAAASLVLFAQLTDEVLEGETHAFDETVLLALRNPADTADPIGPVWLEGMMRDFTALGSLGVLTFLSLAVVGFLVLQGKRRTALLVVVAVGGGIVVSMLTKAGFNRPRPDLVSHGARVFTASFPSAHSMMAAVVYLTLGALLARVQPRLDMRLYLIGLAGALTAIVGFSRVYLGVHWPTDVLAGWALGAAWALGCWAIALWLQVRGRIEPPPDGHDAGGAP